MPWGERLVHPGNGSLSFLHYVCHEPLQALVSAGLFQNDVRLDNVVMWRGRLYLIDFGYATWVSECSSTMALRCGRNRLQAPELARADFAGCVGEAQLVFTLGSLLLDALSADFDDMLYFERWSGHAIELVEAVDHLITKCLKKPDKVPQGWEHGLSSVIELLKQLMAVDPLARPSFADSVAMLDQVWYGWHLLRCEEQKQQTQRF